MVFRLIKKRCENAWVTEFHASCGYEAMLTLGLSQLQYRHFKQNGSPTVEVFHVARRSQT